MKASILDIVPILFLILVLYKSSFVIPISSVKKDYLSIDNCGSLRGILAAIIVLHHLSIVIKKGILFMVLSKVGFYAVSIFFFLSGFGLQKSYINKENYRDSFIQKRIPNILLPYLMVNVMFWGMHVLFGKVYNIGDFFRAIVEGYPIASHSWYIIVILFFYIVYWLLMLIFKKNYIGMIFGALAWYVIHCCMCMKLGFGKWWYNAAILLIVGMAWGTYEKEITKTISRHYLLVLCCTAILFCIFFVGDLKTEGIIGLISEIMTGGCTTILVVMMLMKVNLGNQITRKLGEISFELYMVQGLMIEGLGHVESIKSNDLLYVVLSFVGTCLLGYIFHCLVKLILSKYFQVLSKKV